MLPLSSYVTLLSSLGICCEVTLNEVVVVSSSSLLSCSTSGNVICIKNGTELVFHDELERELI